MLGPLQATLPGLRKRPGVGPCTLMQRPEHYNLHHLMREFGELNTCIFRIFNKLRIVKMLNPLLYA